MQKWLDNNDILIYSTNSEDKSVIAERFMKTLKAKIYKKMTTNDNISYLPYLIKLVDQCNNTYHYSINKKQSALTEKSETNLKASTFKFNNRVRINKHKNIFGRGYSESFVKRNIYYRFCFEN